MRLLVVCDQGNNRSVTLAYVLKYQGHDVLTAGLATNSLQTLELLGDWADRIFTTARDQRFPTHPEKVQCVNLGPDRYPRPLNKDLLRMAKRATETLGTLSTEA